MKERLSLLADFDSTRPLASAHTIPNSWYFDAELYEAECRTVFAGWRVVGRTDQVKEPGDYITIEVAGEPILVIRGDDRVLRAFHNVCRHRAAPIVNDPCGNVDKLRCRYHGWTYDLTGKLRGTPEFEGVCDFAKEDNGLVPMAVESWGHAVWVHDGKPKQPLAQYLAPLPERAKGPGVESLAWSGRVEYQLNCNWKVYVDNFLDGGYHVNTIHPGLAGVIDYSKYRTEVFDNCSVQLSPLKPPDTAVVEGTVRTGDMAYYWWVYPNFMVNIYSGVMDANLVLPLGPDRCRVIFDFYFAPGTQPNFVSDSIAVAEQVQQEDMQICEQVQRGLQSRSFVTGRFSVKREAGGYHFHQRLAKSLRAEPVA